MRILVCNDDGATAPGITLLASAARALTSEVWIVAPTRKWTAASHQLTFDTDLELTRLAERLYACTGAPADCVVAAMDILFREAERPALVLSGVNDKRNVAEDIAYSGTMAIAREASFWGIPAIALSRDPVVPAADDTTHVARLVELLWNARETWAAPGHWLSVNLPSQLPAPIRQARLGHDKIGGGCDVSSASPDRVVYRNRRGRPSVREPGDENDVLQQGAVSLVRHAWTGTAPMPDAAIVTVSEAWMARDGASHWNAKMSGLLSIRTEHKRT